MSTSMSWTSSPSGGRSADARTSSFRSVPRASCPARSSCDRSLIGTAWLARQLASTGRRLRAGEIHRWMTAPVPLDEGDCAEAIFDGDVLVSCRGCHWTARLADTAPFVTRVMRSSGAPLFLFARRDEPATRVCRLLPRLPHDRFGGTVCPFSCANDPARAREFHTPQLHFRCIDVRAPDHLVEAKAARGLDEPSKQSDDRWGAHGVRERAASAAVIVGLDQCAHSVVRRSHPGGD